MLAGLIDGEQCLSYGVFILPDATCVLFETTADDQVLRWVEPAPRTDWQDAFSAVEVGVAMSGAVRSGSGPDPV